MIKLKNLKLHNFLSHENTEIAFDESQKMLVDGNSGSGKSTLLEAIIWALYGTGRSSNVSLIRRGTDKATVNLSLDKDGSTVVITRSITANKHSVTIMIDGIAHPKTGVRDLQEWIETELTGASYILFVNSIAYLQGGAESFVGQNASARKELLLEIIKTIDFDLYYEKTKAKISSIELEEAVATTESCAAKAAIATAESYVVKRPEVEANISTYEAVSVGYDVEKATLEKQLEGHSDRVNEKAAKEGELKTLTGRKVEVQLHIGTDKTKLTGLIELLAEPLENKESVTKERDDAANKLNETRDAITSIAEINAKRATHLQKKPVNVNYEDRITKAKAEIEAMSAINKCSHGDACPNFATTVTLITAKKIELETIEESYETFINDRAVWEAEFDTMQEIPLGDLQVQEKKHSLDVTVCDERLRKIESIITAKSQEEEIKASVVIWESELVTLLASIEKVEKEVEEINKIGNTVEEEAAANRLSLLAVLMGANKKKIAEAQRELGVIENFEHSIASDKERVTEAKEKIDIIQGQLKQLALLKDAFGSKGIRALVVDYIIPELEEKINDILSQMSEFRVILDTQQEKASGDGSKEGLFITIVNDMGEEMPFENYSGGEKLKIVVAITEALATLQKCGFRLFDETWVGLDETSLESFSQVLNTLLERFPQVVCVSHLTEIKSAFEDKITIVKHNGISHVE